MNLAIRDIRHNLFRFALTAFGVGLLLLGAMGMVGLYRGIVHDALGIIDGIGADLWIVQAGTEGPFAEASNVPLSLTDRVRAVPGVASARAFFMIQQRFKVAGRDVRGSVLGLDFPEDCGAWLPLAAGHVFTAGRGEAVADRATGLRIGDVLTLGTTTLHIIGTTRGFADAFGNPLLVFSLLDVLDINRWRPTEAIHLRRAQSADGRPVPVSTELPDAGRKPGGTTEVAAVMAALHPGADITAVRQRMEGWGDVSVLDHDQERQVFLLGRLDRLRKQVLLFSFLLIAISAVVVSLTIYMMTLEKLHDIALLKLIGARSRIVVGLVLEQALLIGEIAFVFAVFTGRFIYPFFPRSVVQTPVDFILFAGLTLIICTVGSALGINRAMNVRAQEVLS